MEDQMWEITWVVVPAGEGYQRMGLYLANAGDECAEGNNGRIALHLAGRTIAHNAEKCLGTW